MFVFKVTEDIFGVLLVLSNSVLGPVYLEWCVLENI